MSQVAYRGSKERSACITLFGLVGLQLLVALVVSFAWCFISKGAGLSAFLGATTVIFPSAYFAWRLATAIHARQSKKLVKAFYQGELVKLGLMGILAIIVIRADIIEPLPFFCGLVGAQFGFWLAPLTMRWLF